MALDPLAVDVEQLGCLELARPDAPDRLGGRELDRGLAPWPGVGTRKPPCAGSGADSSTRSTGQLSLGSSGRITFSTAITCEVGATPSRSSSEIFSMWSSTVDSSRDMRSISSPERRRRASRATWRT
jgi:hypothetical protein